MTSTWPLRARLLAPALLAVLLVAPACRGDGNDEGERPAGIQTRAVATGLPEGARVVVSGYDLQGFWTRLQATRLYTELKAVQGVRDVVAPLAQSGRDMQNEICVRLDERTILSLFGEKFDIGFYGELDEDRADLLLVADVSDEGDAREIVEECERQIETEKGATFADDEIGGVDVRVASNREGEEVLFYTLEGGRLALATTRERLTGALGLRGEGGTAKAMTTVDSYLDVLGKLPEASLVLYVDQAALRAAAARAGTADTTTSGTPEERLRRQRFRAASAAFGDTEVADAIGLGVSWTETGVRGDLYTRLPSGRRTEIAQMLTRAPSPVRSLAFQPEGTLLYGAINSLDAQVVYRELYRYAIDATRVQIGVDGTPDSMRADSVVAAGLASFESETGLDVEDEIVSWIGGEAAFSVAGVDKTGFFPIPQVALTVATKDRGRTAAMMAELEGLLAETARTRASIPLQWQSVEHQGQTIRYAPTPLGEGLSIAWVATDEFLVLATNRALVQRMLDVRAGGAQALPSNPGFSAMTDFYPSEVNAIGFVNLEAILTEVEGLLSTMGQMRGAVPDSAGTERRVLAALKNAPRLGFYSEADDAGVYGHFLLEIR